VAAPLQEGIYHAPGRRPGRFFALLFLRVREGAGAPAAGAALADLWAMYQGLKAGRVRDLDGVSLPADEDQMTVLLGFGRNAFALDGIAAARPHGLADEYLFRSADPAGGGPLLRGSGLHYAAEVRANMATEAFCVQVIAESKLAVDRAVVETWKLLADAAPQPLLELTTFYLGHQRNDRRSWIDFHDGLSNLRSEDRESVIAIGPGTDEGWAVGGTYLAFLRLAVDLVGWRKLERRDQELAVGRDKLSGCPIVAADGDGLHTDPGCPVTGTQIWQTPNDVPFAEPPADVDGDVVLASHVQRANHHIRPASDSGSRRIFRQGYEFLEWADAPPGFRAGLNFVSFQDTPGRILKMLTAGGWLGATNFGGDEAAHPELASLLSVYAASVYFVAPVVEGEAFPGAAALGVAVVAPQPASGAVAEPTGGAAAPAEAASADLGDPA
jgi:deferrochelatase/peroxidase EfeB